MGMTKSTAIRTNELSAGPMGQQALERKFIARIVETNE
jgi:hypothetical protein